MREKPKGHKGNKKPAAVVPIVEGVPATAFASLQIPQEEIVGCGCGHHTETALYPEATGGDGDCLYKPREYVVSKPEPSVSVEVLAALRNSKPKEEHVKLLEEPVKEKKEVYDLTRMLARPKPLAPPEASHGDVRVKEKKVVYDLTRMLARHKPLAPPETPPEASPGDVRVAPVVVDKVREGVLPWRRVLLPMEAMDRFLDAASGNTNRGIETCGVLCGVVEDGVLKIVAVILPKQQGRPDSCETQSEEEMAMVQIQRDWLSLGWIHVRGFLLWDKRKSAQTHPTQSCFMSSLDLHTHAHYQSMLSESIAVVMAPRSTPSVGIFNLIEPEGLEYVVQCKKKGFHPHGEMSLYQTSPRVIVAPGGCEIIDLR